MKATNIQDNILFSIIIPIYKVEPYIIRCLESINAQDFNAWEAILVDDGTPDKSGEMAKEYASQHKGFKYIKQVNSGLSCARNTGINNAKGKYLLFLDSDDYLVNYTLSKIADNLRQRTLPLDVLYLDINRISGDTQTVVNKKNIQGLGVASGLEYFKKELESSKFHAMAQGGVYLREFIVDNRLYFKKGIYHEDENWMPKVELSAQNVAYAPICFYNYEIRPGSITTHGDNIKNGYDLVNTTKELYEIYQRIDTVQIKELALRYNAKLFLRGTSIVLRCGGTVSDKKKLVYKNWITLKDAIQFFIFLILPRFYALTIDKYLLH